MKINDLDNMTNEEINRITIEEWQEMVDEFLILCKKYNMTEEEMFIKLKNEDINRRYI